ncbi:MAG: hypothetical protein LBR07_08630 [Puniceicoccales bacterium]|jgi:DNA polymerase-3 subunit delta|nr:hypothetical protein [Puniceicoccales bacterium]
MSAASTPRFRFFCGDDDFLVNNAARECFEKLAAGADAFSREVIDGAVLRAEEALELVRRFADATLTVSMFGDKRHVWLRGINWLGLDRTSTAEDAKTAAANLLEVLKKNDPAATSIVISAISPNGVRKDVKELKKDGAAVEIKLGKEGRERTQNLDEMLEAECERQGISMSGSVRAVLLEKVGDSPRMATEEIRKLAIYVGVGTPDGGADITTTAGDGRPRITTAMIHELVPEFGEADAFEAAEAFYSGDADYAFSALHRHFFKAPAANHEKAFRALLGNFVKRNRICLQLRALTDARLRGKAEAAEARYAALFGETGTVKSEFHVFKQHPFYLEKLAAGARKFTLRQLIDIQLDLSRLLVELINKDKNNTTPEAIMRAFFTRHLGGAGA